MNDFQDAAPGPFFNVSAFLLAWERSLGFERGFQAATAAERTAIMQRLRARTKPLWERFNVKREALDKHYMDDPAHFQGYLGSFYLPNVQRVFHALSGRSLRAALCDLMRAGLERPERTLTLCDFGCGPLSASAGFLAFLSQVLASDAMLSREPLTVRIFAVDRARRSVEIGRDILSSACGAKLSLEVHPLPSLEKLPETVDLFLGVNVLNEIPEKHRGKAISGAFSRLNPAGIALWMEPGQEVHSRTLMKLRDDFLGHEAGAEVVAPCLHTLGCPLLSERKDWCWFRCDWRRPQALACLDSFSRLEHDELSFSYVAFRRATGVASAGPQARVVSDPIPVGDGGSPEARKFMAWARRNLSRESAPWPQQWSEEALVSLRKLLLCTRDGHLEAAVICEGALPARGELVMGDDLPVRCLEVCGKSPQAAGPLPVRRP